jgi:hypothetical protein
VGEGRRFGPCPEAGKGVSTLVDVFGVLLKKTWRGRWRTGPEGNNFDGFAVALIGVKRININSKQ